MSWCKSFEKSVNRKVLRSSSPSLRRDKRLHSKSYYPISKPRQNSGLLGKQSHQHGFSIRCYVVKQFCEKPAGSINLSQTDIYLPLPQLATQKVLERDLTSNSFLLVRYNNNLYKTVIIHVTTSHTRTTLATTVRTPSPSGLVCIGTASSPRISSTST